MTSHVGLMLLFAVFVSLVFAVIAKDRPADQLQAGAKMFGSFIAAARPIIIPPTSPWRG